MYTKRNQPHPAWRRSYKAQQSVSAVSLRLPHPAPGPDELTGEREGRGTLL